MGRSGLQCCKLVQQRVGAGNSSASLFLLPPVVVAAHGGRQF